MAGLYPCLTGYFREAGGLPIILGAPFIAVSSRMRWGPLTPAIVPPVGRLPHIRAFEMGLQTLPSPSLPADPSRIGGACFHPAYLISLNLKLQKPVKPLGAQKSLNQHKLINLIIQNSWHSSYAQPAILKIEHKKAKSRTLYRFLCFLIFRI